jgi:hypothetical protein
MDPLDIPTAVTKLTYRRIKAIGDAGIPVLSQNQTAEFLAHYWPAIEAHTREQIAQDIEAAIERNHAEYPHIEAMGARRLGLRQAARIARAETWDGSAPTADAS